MASKRIYKLVLENLNFETVVQRVADAIPEELQFGTGVVSILDEEKGVIRRIAASQTKEAQDAIKALKVPFKNIEISVSDPNNLMAKAIRENKFFVTTDVYDVLGPVLNRAEAQEIQKIMGTSTTLIYPISSGNAPIGVFIASTKKKHEELTLQEYSIINDFVNIVGIALQNSKLYSSLQKTSEKLAIANQRLKKFDQLKDDFVSLASHELRTPMTAIRSYAWMALYRPDMKLSEKMEKYLTRILMSTERLINLVNDMLNISRIESGRIDIIPEAVDLISLCKDIADEVYYSKGVSKKVEIVILEKPTPKVFADPDKLRQVFLNLVGNALKFTPNGGSITFSFFSDGKVVETSIKDTGVGISKEDLSKLFQKFGRLDSSYVAAATSGGTGLGLYISKKLVELMHGRIWASSEGLGKGTIFTVSLPVASAATLQHADLFRVKARGGEAKGLESVAI